MSIIISNDSAITAPIVNGTHAYEADFDRPKFFVNNHYLTPVKQCYNYNLPNPVSLNTNHTLTIKVKIPKQILGNKYGYELENFNNVSNLMVSLRLKSSDGCRDIDNVTTNINEFCGWYILELEYIPQNDICNLCNISYSLCFDPLKLKTLYAICNQDKQENINFDSSTCLEIKYSEEEICDQFIIQLGDDIDGEAFNDQSGYSVSLSSDGTIVAIGARYNDGVNGSNSGRVRVYQYIGSNWNQLGQDINGEAVNDELGWSVSLSSDGKIVAIGAYKNDGINGVDTIDSGHVRVYEYDGTNWNQLGQDIDGEAANDRSGYSVSLSSDGTIIAIGATLNDGNGGSSGHVRVYKYDATKTTAETNQDSPDFGPIGWRRLGDDIDGEALSDESGYSVSLSSDGTIVAIGARYNDGNGSNNGHVRVYEYDGTNWNKLGNDIDGEADNDNSGYSVSLSSDGTIVAIGAIFNDGNSIDSSFNSGHVRIYQYDGATWNQIGQDIDGEAANDQSGWSVSLSSDGKIVAIGAAYNDDNYNNSGHVRVYQLCF